jgi:hypothetical protein
VPVRQREAIWDPRRAEVLAALDALEAAVRRGVVVAAEAAPR